jgi:hypothetical protein
MASKSHFVLALALAAIGCAPTTTTPSDTTVTKAEAPRGCPLGVPGAIVTATDTEGGVALTFIAPANTDEMRSRVRDAASLWGPGTHLGAGHDGTHGTGGDHGLKAMQLPPVNTGVDEIEGGARLRLVAIDAADRDALRAKAHERAEHMNAASCR